MKEFNMSNQVLIVDHDENATILAALRFYQEKGQGDPCNRSDYIHDLATNGGDVLSSLDDEGIDDLCMRSDLRAAPGPLVTLLREPIEMWPQFDGDHEVDGSDAVEWLGDYRRRLQAMLTELGPLDVTQAQAEDHTSQSKTVTRTIDGANPALAMAMKIATLSAWFEFHPLLNDQYKFTVEAENELVLLNDADAAYALIQEGGSSAELYIHSHPTRAEAEADRLDCKDNGCYRTSSIIELPPVVAMLGEHFYGVATALIDAANYLDFPEDAKWDETDTAAAAAQGWGISIEDGEHLLVSNGESEKFADDVDAVGYVKHRAREGDALASKAIRYLLAKTSPDVHEFGLADVVST